MWTLLTGTAVCLTWAARALVTATLNIKSNTEGIAALAKLLQDKYIDKNETELLINKVIDKKIRKDKYDSE
jgi:hypothetical protein